MILEMLLAAYLFVMPVRSITRRKAPNRRRLNVRALLGTEAVFGAAVAAEGGCMVLYAV